MLPLGGCLLSAEKIDPALDIPAAYDRGPKNAAAAEAALPPLDWWRSFRSRKMPARIAPKATVGRQAELRLASISGPVRPPLLIIRSPCSWDASSVDC